MFFYYYVHLPSTYSEQNNTEKYFLLYRYNTTVCVYVYTVYTAAQRFGISKIFYTF